LIATNHDEGDSSLLLAQLQTQVIQTGVEARRRGIVCGTAGNFSVGAEATGSIPISPSVPLRHRVCPRTVQIPAR
jgi:hypothetical protein